MRNTSSAPLRPGSETQPSLYAVYTRLTRQEAALAKQQAQIALLEAQVTALQRQVSVLQARP